MDRHHPTRTLRFLRGAALAALAGTAGFLLADFGDAGAQSSAPPLRAEVPAPSAGLADLVESVSPAVVSIQVRAAAIPSGFESSRPFDRRDFFFDRRRPLPQPRPRQGLGSGFIVDPDGYVVTNNHVIDGAEEVEVTLGDGRSFAAEVVGTDPQTDLALLKVEAGEDLPYVTFAAPGTTRVGDWVVAVGNPFGLGGTVTTGIVSALGRDIGSGPYADHIQIDAAINSGNSGGPAFNLKGEVIGVNSAIFSPTGGNVGIGFAVSADTATKIIADLKTDGSVTRGWLGVQIQPITPDMAESLDLARPEGALVVEVFADSAASRAGLRRGDVVRAVNGGPVSDPRDLSRAVADLDVGSNVEFDIVRRGAERTVTVTVGERRDVDALARERRGGRRGPGRG